MADTPIHDIPERAKDIHNCLCLKLSDNVYPGSEAWNDLLVQLKSCLSPAEVDRLKKSSFGEMWDMLEKKGRIGVGDYKFLVEKFDQRNHIPLVNIINTESERIDKLKRSNPTKRRKTGKWHITQYEVYIITTSCIEPKYRK